MNFPARDGMVRLLGVAGPCIATASLVSGRHANRERRRASLLLVSRAAAGNFLPSGPFLLFLPERRRRVHGAAPAPIRRVDDDR
jgi:hypothetical protein